MKKCLFSLRCLSLLAVMLMMISFVGCSNDSNQMVDELLSTRNADESDSTNAGPVAMEEDAYETDTLKDVLDVKPEDWVVGKWKMVESAYAVVPDDVDDVWIFSSDGSSRHEFYNRVYGKMVDESPYFIVLQKGYMCTARKQLVAPFEHCLKFGVKGHTSAEYGISFTEDKMYMTAINGYFFRKESYIFQRVR